MNQTGSDRPVLSVLITVFNQSETLKWNLDSLLANDGTDYEIVVQDDCSEEDIEALVREYRDERIRYYRNPVNYGHDRNIIEGFQNCRSEYVFLLRTSDTILPGKIKTIIEGIKNHPEAAYGRYSCVDENGEIRFRYEDYLSSGRRDTIRLNEKLWIHPSGELFNKRYLQKKDWKTLEEYLDKYFHDRNKFILNEMIRDKLCTKGPFFSSGEIVWVYTRTVNRKDVAQNRNKKGVCIYAPPYMYERFRSEISYIVHEVGGGVRAKKRMISQKFLLYARMTIWDFKKINRNPDMQRHYGYGAVPFSCREELGIFRKEACLLAKELPYEYGKLLRAEARKLSWLTLVWWQMKSAFSSLRFFAGKMRNRKDRVLSFLLSYLPGYQSKITLKELTENKDFFIEPFEAEELISGSKITHYRYSFIPLGKIRRSKDGQFTSLRETVNYRFLSRNDSKEVYKEYLRYANDKSNRRDNPNRSPEQFLKLKKELLCGGGYNPNKGIIVLDQYNNVLIGLHRACILLKAYGEECRIPVLKTRAKSSRLLFFKALCYNISQFLEKKKRKIRVSK